MYAVWEVKEINIQFWLKISRKMSQLESNNDIKADCNEKYNNVN
jgi:hypothetical protein